MTCGTSDADECAMTVDDESFDMTGDGLECGVCNLDGEIIEVASTDAGSGSRLGPMVEKVHMHMSVEFTTF